MRDSWRERNFKPISALIFFGLFLQLVQVLSLEDVLGKLEEYKIYLLRANERLVFTKT